MAFGAATHVGQPAAPVAGAEPDPVIVKQFCQGRWIGGGGVEEVVAAPVRAMVCDRGRIGGWAG